MTTPDEMQGRLTLRQAAIWLEELRARAADEGTMPRQDALYLLALSEVVARKAGYGRQLDIRVARAAGASWSQIGAALGVTKQSAWEAYTRWIEEQARLNEATGYTGMSRGEAAAARLLGGQD